MSGVLNKLFNDIGSLDNLLKSVNGLAGSDNKYEAVMKTVELARKNKDLLERKANDLEQFFLDCNQEVGTPVVLAGLRALFDTASAKNNETSMDRCVEIFKHFMEANKLVREHALMCPDIFFPFARSMIFYCLQKKNNAEVAVTVASLCMRLAVHPEERFVSSLHSAFLAACLKNGNYEDAMVHIYSHISGLVNEVTPSTSPCADGADANVPASSRRLRCYQTPFFESVNLLQYFYYSSLVLIKVGEYRRALAQLENCLTFPGNITSQIQIDAFKKFYIVSLMVYGKVTIPVGRTAALQKSWRSKGRCDPYVQLMNAMNDNSNKAEAAISVLTENWNTFQEDQNIGIIQLLIESLKITSVMNIAKSYSSILLPNLAARAFSTVDQVVLIIKNLVEKGELEASIDPETEVVLLSVPSVPVSKDVIQGKSDYLNCLRMETDRMDLAAQMNPALLARTLKGNTLSYLDDEGVSNPIDL